MSNPAKISTLIGVITTIAPDSHEAIELLTSVLATIVDMTKKKEVPTKTAAKNIAAIVYEKAYITCVVSELLKNEAPADKIKAAIEVITKEIDNNELPAWLQ